MRSVIALAVALSVLGFNSRAMAHEPGSRTHFVWQWPESALPHLDGFLNEWEVIPAEFWITEQDVVQSGPWVHAYKGDLDISSISFRWALSWNEETNRLYWGYQRFDDISMDAGLETIEGAVDADHSGGTMWDIEGMTDEEALRQRGRHAQIFHWSYAEGCGTRITPQFWMTQADWYDNPAFYDQGHRVEGTPCGGGETTTFAEWYQVWWDDFNWQDPEGSIIHDFEVDEIIGSNTNVFDQDAETADDCNCRARWSLGPDNTNAIDADFFQDWVLLPVDETADFVTAVEGDSWGRIKASLAK